MATPDSLPADPNQPVITNGAELAQAFGAWFASATDEQRRAFVDGHGDRARELQNRGELPEAEVPRTWLDD